MSDIRIEPLNESNAVHLNTIDGTFTVDAVLEIGPPGFGERLVFIPVEPYEKQYDTEKIDITAYIGSNERTAYFAFSQNDMVGQVVLRKNWNQIAYVEDIGVDRAFRRQGIGHALVHQMVRWTKEMNLSGIMLETQNNNQAACRFYQAEGFKIGGYDRYLYKGINNDTNEIAVFWYRFI